MLNLKSVELGRKNSELLDQNKTLERERDLLRQAKLDFEFSARNAVGGATNAIELLELIKAVQHESTIIFDLMQQNGLNNDYMLTHLHNEANNLRLNVVNSLESPGSFSKSNPSLYSETSIALENIKKHRKLAEAKIMGAAPKPSLD